MRIRHHKTFGHGLAPGHNSDMNCRSCIREDSEQIAPDITGKDNPQPSFVIREPDLPKKEK